MIDDDSFEIDFRLGEISAELSTLHGYLDLLRSEADNLKKTAVEGMQKTFDLNDPVERDTAEEVADYIQQIGLPRFIWGTFIVSAWAVFEAAVIEIADFLGKANNTSLRIRDLKSDLLTQAKLYYEGVLRFPLTDFEGQAWEQIVHMNRVRNAVAHAAGRLDMVVPSEKLSALRKTIAQNVGVSVDSIFEQYLVIDQDFARASIEAIDTILSDAVERAKKEADRLHQAQP